MIYILRCGDGSIHSKHQFYILLLVVSLENKHFLLYLRLISTTYDVFYEITFVVLIYFYAMTGGLVSLRDIVHVYFLHGCVKFYFP